jgi:GH15 family glucan-1,4-alpha-glucosidase
MKTAQNKYLPIEDHGVIGNQQTIALVGINGSIDFMCFPDFDSPSVFAALLDYQKGGFFQVAPLENNVKTKQSYLLETNILETHFLLEKGMGVLTDFMPVAPSLKRNLIIRKLKNIKGTISYRMQCSPRFNYASSSHQAQHSGNMIIFKSKGNDALGLKLTSSVPLHLKNGDGYAEFTLNANETAEFILENIQVHENSHSNISDFVEFALNQTHVYWKNWASKSTYQGLWRENVIRSALILKLMISEKYGSIVAAPTFSLPEKIGGEKNWDYRFSWIRDAAFTVYSLMRIGYKDEAYAFMQWIHKILKNIGENFSFQPFYSMEGKTNLKKEEELTYLEGYKQSYPVRTGNDAYQQLQLDIYGELADALYLYDKEVAPISHEAWKGLEKLINWVAKNWGLKDHGIWEIRGNVQEFLYSKIMCWVAIDRVMKIGIRRSFPFPNSWIKTRDEIYQYIYKNFWNKKLQAFVQMKNYQIVDASTLLMPLMRIISPKDPMWLSTLHLIEKKLMLDCLVHRYPPQEATQFGLKPGEGTFTACSFWYIECLSRAGQLQKAQINFDKMLNYANHSGLYSEQLGLQGQHLGNFPQALTHLALISAAYDLNKRLNQKS